MKKSISIILLASSLLFILLSCNDNDDNYVPEAYRKILSLKESGIKDYSMNANQSSITENILILRGGGEPHSESNMEMYIMSKEDCNTMDRKFRKGYKNHPYNLCNMPKNQKSEVRD